MAALTRWHVVTSTDYHTGTPVDIDMYFLTDTHEIYRGTELFTQAVNLCTVFPTTSIAINRLYVNSTTLEGRVYDGTKWTTVIKPVEDTVSENGNPVSGKAVATYVAAEMAKVTTSENTVSSLSWDSAEHLLAVTKGDKSVENIVFDGLGVNLQYNAETGKLQLVDAKGNSIGNAINLDLERFVHSGKYDTNTKNIILYFDNKTDVEDKDRECVTIPVGDLVDTYIAQGDGKSLDLTVENNVIKGSIKISTQDGNLITADENGLYVAPIDISGKMDKDTDAVVGDIAVFDENGNAVDSGKQFDDLLPNNSVYEGSSLESAITGKTPIKGDIVIVSEAIGNTGKFQKTVYQYDGLVWKAFDSNYDASKVILSQDWLTTTKIGVIQTLTNGQAIIAKAGTDVMSALAGLTTLETDSTVTQPAVSFSNSSDNEFKAYEVGTTVDIALTATLSAGSYSYGRINSNGEFESDTSAGVSAKTWTFTDSNGVQKTGSNTVTFDSIEVEDGTSYNVTAKADYDASAYTPATNLKNPAKSASAISAGSKQKTTANITGYRNCFYGTFTSKVDLSTVEGKSTFAANIRNLTKTNSSVSAGKALTMSVPVGVLRAVIAYPADVANTGNILAEVKDVNGMNAEINSAFTLIQLDIEGANGYTAKAYKVFYIDFAEAVSTANTYKIKI